MPKAKDPLPPDEQRRRFEDEIRRQKEAGDFDQKAADDALNALVKRQSQSEKYRAKDRD
jgi:hypothetical protein